MTRVLAFDIGIKNLAWCCLEKQNATYTILGWDNYNLLSDSSNVDDASKKQKCAYCSAKATYQTIGSEKVTCVRHCSPLYPALRDCSGVLLKKIPGVSGCRQLLTSKGLEKLPAKKQALEEELAKFFSFPIVSKKVSKAPDVGLSEIHDSMKRLVTLQKDLWSSCSTILLENQPVYKNPTMKSVQILLFATLRDLLQQPPPMLKLVHAGKKVKDAATGDAGYKERKAGSEARVEQFFKDPNLLNGPFAKTIWGKATKKSDLADALCMCLDALTSA
jgi:hypothetical protein